MAGVVADTRGVDGSEALAGVDWVLGAEGCGLVGLHKN